MLDDQGFNEWCQRLNLSQAACQVVKKIRTSDPCRQVQGNRSNVCGSYPSFKMGVTIQFESHRNELARIYELEHDPDVLEYYDQPPSIELDYQAKSGRRNRHSYTPDFFVLHTNWAGWEECKTEQELIKLAEDSPNRYQKGHDNQWHCPPAEEYAARYGFYFCVWSSAKVNWTFQQNIIWLEDYLRVRKLTVDKKVIQAVTTLLEASRGITLADLLQHTEIASPNDIYMLIAAGQIYVDLEAARLAEPEQVQVFLNQPVALAYQRMTEIAAPRASSIQLLQVAVGTSLLWDGECWEVVNTGATTTGLVRSDGKFIELPNATFDALIQQGKITAAKETEPETDKARVEEILRHARPEDIVEANRRYELIQPYLGIDAPATPSSTIRRWRSQYRKAEAIYGSGYIGLLPNHQTKGNHTPRLDETVRDFMVKFIEEHYETLKHRRQLRVYESFVAACEANEPKLTPPSSKTFYAVIKQRSGATQTEKRSGRRAAIQKRPVYLELELTTPRHGDRPFEIVHIDHTQLDIELVSSLASLTQCNVNPVSTTPYPLGRPWATFMVDAYSRRLLAVYLTYDEPSYRSCMAVLRICVQRFRRFPQSIVVDNGAEFHSHYFEQLLAHFACTKKHRPPAEARFGFVVERLFGTANTQFVHELRGNTQITRQHRQVTKSTKPDKQAVWTLGNLYDATCEWAYEVYDQREHPALGQSPRDAFASGLALGGSRLHRRVEYDGAFRILTLPAPEPSRRKVQPGQGVKIYNIYYWSNTFRDPEIEQSMVEVKYDPFDASVAYALVRGQWVQCISAYYQYLKGRSEKEIRLVSAELNKRKRDQGRKVMSSDRELVQFLNSLEAKEGKFLEQHLRAAENRHVVQVIEGIGTDSSQQPDDLPASGYEATTLTEGNQVRVVAQSVLQDKGGHSDHLEFYGEF